MRVYYVYVTCVFSVFQFNFVGRILGPRGMTAKQLEQETGCKIMVRGRGSMRDKKKVSIDEVLLMFTRLSGVGTDFVWCN